MKSKFGGALLKNKRKSKRILSFTKPTHLVLRLKQNLPPLFDPHDFKLRRNIFRLASKYEIKIYGLVLNHTHVHGAILLPERANYVNFIRELTSFLTDAP